MFGDGCGERRDAGVSFLGRDLIAAMNEVDMILDLSHAGHRTRAEATELAKWPVCTHSNAYDLLPNDRNTKDETIRAIAETGVDYISTSKITQSAPAVDIGLDAA
mgnify:CR=1 FL=1